MGFKELSHTADWSLMAWAEDLPSLFAEAARGMNSLSGAQPASGPRLKRKFEAEESDDESLLVAFLTELVYAQEQENLGFDQFDIRITNHHLAAAMEGASLASLAKPIKAVTYHNLEIRKTTRGYAVEIVFDV